MSMKNTMLMKNSAQVDEGGNYSEVTRGIRVSVYPQPLVSESDPSARVYAFAYTITVENEGQDSVQLIERHWLIYSGRAQMAEVVGPGVVGVQPVLGSGQSFQYTSSAVIQEPYGSMQGSYTFRSEDGTFFQVGIPRFDLFYPLMVH